MKKKILFIDREQFGSLTDSLKYCEYLHDTYSISYLCIDKGRPKVTFPNMKVTYIPKIKPRALRGSVFILTALLKCLFFRGKIFILYFPKCEIIKRIIFWKKMHLDIRTLSIKKDTEERNAENNQICKSINCFNSVSFITQPIANLVSVKSSIKQFILPLGADVISNTNKEYNHLHLLYVGALEGRDIIKTVQGVELFITQNPTQSIFYDIVGDGIEFDMIKTYIERHNLSQYIKMWGRIPYKSLKPFLDTHNIGISFVPITPGYDLQPPTKTYEYILSGLFCIATKTTANCEVIINDKNGYLIEDTAKSFCDALKHLLQNKHSYNSSTIRNSLINFQWKILIDKYLKTILED